MATGVCDSIITDEEWLWQIMMNLLTNAGKHTTTGVIDVIISVVQGTLPTPGNLLGRSQRLFPQVCDMLHIEVRDTGRKI